MMGVLIMCMLCSVLLTVWIADKVPQPWRFAILLSNFPAGFASARLAYWIARTLTV